MITDMKRKSYVVSLLLLFMLISVCSAQAEDVRIPKLKQLKQKDLETKIVPAENKGKWGFADEKGKFVIKPVFTEVTPFENQLSKVAVDDFWGIIRRDATYLFEPQFSAIDDFVQWNDEDEIAKVVRYGRYGIISSKGETLLQPEYESIDTDVFREYGCFLVKEEGNKGVVDKHGVRMCESQYEKVFLIKSNDNTDGYCFLGLFDGKYSIIIPPSGSEGIQIINAGESPDVVGCKYAIYSQDDGILEGIGISAVKNLYSVSGKKYQIPPVECIQYRNGGAIIKCDDNGFYILNKGKVQSYYEYNLAMSENAYVDDEILPEWARLYSTIDTRSNSNSVITFNDGNLQLKYESILGGCGVGGFMGGFGLTDKQGRWLVKPVLTKSQIKTTEGVRIYPCDLAGSAIVGYNGKYGRVSESGLKLPLIFNTYEDAVKYNGHKMQNSDYYVVITEDRTENGFQKYGYADDSYLIIPVQYYCYDYGDVGYLIDDISTAGYLVVNTVPSDSRKLVVINLKNEVVGPPEGVDAYEYKKELNIKSLFRVTEIPIKYEGIEHISNSSNSLSKVYNNGKYGLIDKSGREVTPCVYDFIDYWVHEGMIKVMTNEKYGYVDESGKEVIPCVYDFAVDFSCGLSNVKKGNKWGFVNKSGKEVIPCIYDYASAFSDGYAIVKKDGKFGIIKKDGQFALPIVYDFIEELQDGVAPIKRNGKYGLFARGKEMVPCVYDSYKPLSSGVGWNKHWAIFKNGIKNFNGDIHAYNNNHSKEIYISPTTGEVYDKIEWSYDAPTEVKKEGKTIFISTTGKKYSYCSGGKKEGYYVVENNGKRGMVDKMGKEVLPCIYESVDYSFVEDYLRVKKNGKWGFVDTNWEEVLPCIYEEASDFSEGYVSVKKGGKWGFIDKKGKALLPFKYDEESFFFKGYARVRKGGGYGVIDITGEEVVPCIYDGLSPLKSGAFVVENNDKYGIIDKSGKEVLPVVYDLVLLEGHKGDLDVNYVDGGIIVAKDAKYLDVDDVVDGDIIVAKDGKYGVVYNNGKVVMPCVNNIIGGTVPGAAAVYDGDDSFVVLSYMGKRYDRAEILTNHLTKVEIDDKYGIIDNTGKEVVSCIYDVIKTFGSEEKQKDYFGVRRNNKYGIINKEGIEVVPCIYDEIAEYYPGGVIMKKGKEEIFVSFRNKKYDGGAARYSDDYTLVAKSKKIGFIDKMGNEVVECEFDHIFENDQEYQEDRVIISKGGKLFIIEQINRVM